MTTTATDQPLDLGDDLVEMRRCLIATFVAAEAALRELVVMADGLGISSDDLTVMVEKRADTVINEMRSEMTDLRKFCGWFNIPATRKGD
jgi:hypothetical protein